MRSGCQSFKQPPSTLADDIFTDWTTLSQPEPVPAILELGSLTSCLTLLGTVRESALSNKCERDKEALCRYASTTNS